MINRTGNRILLQTKFQRPRLPSNLVHRPRLIAPLNDGLDRPLILVAAPAGFGKSMLLSAWLETCNLPHAWISLEESDNDLDVFLAYFLEAIRTLFPDGLPETQAFLNGISLPDVTVIANSLVNELDDLKSSFILVLDDYHVIHKDLVHELLSLLLQHPPRGIHLVIATRQDPLLPLSMLRARDQISDIRGENLRFSRTEVAEFVEKALGLPLDDETLAVLAEKTEGWAVGLRLATLTLRFSENIDAHLVEMRAKNRYILDYLTSEVLANITASMKSFLLKTSIVDRVCASLGEALIGQDDPTCQPQDYLLMLEQTQMFTMALDAHGEWYRYHHLFQELLRDQLTHQTSAEEIAVLHTRASHWYARHGELEQAIDHALRGHDITTAVHLIAEQRHALMDSEQWLLHERILHMFPIGTIENHPDLILMAAWMARLGRFDLVRSMELVDRAESLLDEQSEQSPHAVHLKGEIDTLRCAVAADRASDPENIITLAHRALATTPRAWYYVRSTAWLYLSVAYQMIGKLDQAYATLAEGEPEDLATHGGMSARIAGSRCFIEWMSGNLSAIAQGADHIRTVSESHHRRESLGWAHYLLSGTAYECNDLKTAEVHAQSIEKLRFVSRPMAYLQSAFIYTSIFQAQGQPEQARQKLDMAFAFLKETHNEGLVSLAQAFQAELAVMQGDLGATRHWATTIGPFLPFTLMPYFYTPQLTLPKILLAQDTLASRKQAAELLAQLHTFVTDTHNTRVTIQVLVLQAMVNDAQGNELDALILLQQALSLAEPGGLIRLFVDLGPRLSNLLKRLRQMGIDSDYAFEILQAFGEPARAAPHPNEAVAPMGEMAEIERLTEREHEILLLLGQRLTAREIGQELGISHLTVKRHTATIYQKFQVNGRREAVAKAIRLGLL